MNAQDRAWKDYSERFKRDVLPKLLASGIFLSFGSEVGDFDVRQATELGAALLCGQPLLLVIPTGRTISPQLRRAADEIVEGWEATDPDAQERLFAAMHRLGAA